jgi:hypothetical protein
VKAFRAELSFYLPIFKIKNKKEKREIEQNKKKKRRSGPAHLPVPLLRFKRP